MRGNIKNNPKGILTRGFSINQKSNITKTMNGEEHVQNIDGKDVGGRNNRGKNKTEHFNLGSINTPISQKKGKTEMKIILQNTDSSCTELEETEEIETERISRIYKGSRCKSFIKKESKDERIEKKNDHAETEEQGGSGDSSKADREAENPVNTLKNTFTSMLIKIQLGKNYSVSDKRSGSYNITDIGQLENDLKISFHYLSLGQPGGKTFMHFSSEAGKGFIISDGEEVTGVISIKNQTKLCQESSETGR